MTDSGEWTTMPVRQETRERVREARPEDAHSVDEFVNTLLDAYDAEGGSTELYGVGDDEPVERIDEVLGASKADVPSADEIANAVLKDMEAQLPEKVADAVEARLR